MLSTDIPTKFPIPFASGATAPYISPIPEASLIGIQNGRASLTDGFPPLTFDPLAAGGDPPWGADFNGILKQITQWLQWAAAGGLPVGYDATFSAKIGGYPKYALLQAATGDRYWLSTVDNNVTDPDTGGAGWKKFPDVIVQKQAGNFAVDTGTVNNYTIALDPIPSTLADIIGSPIRVEALHANTVNNPLIHINAATGSTTATMINSNGNPLLIGQIARAGQIFEGFLDTVGFFQVTTPAPIVGGSSGALTGVVYEWGAEVPPTWGLECNGARYNISDYPNLWNVIQNRFNAAGTPPGDGVNTFNVPDKRGAFTRGWDHGRGLDPNAGTRTTTCGGTAVVGDHVGSWQTDSIRSISGAVFALFGPTINLPAFNHGGTPIPIESTPLTLTPQAHNDLSAAIYGIPIGGGLDDAPKTVSYANFTDPTPGPADTITSLSGTVTATLGLETRPVNIDMMYVIAI